MSDECVKCVKCGAEAEGFRYREIGRFWYTCPFCKGRQCTFCNADPSCACGNDAEWRQIAKWRDHPWEIAKRRYHHPRENFKNFKITKEAITIEWSDFKKEELINILKKRAADSSRENEACAGDTSNK